MKGKLHREDGEGRFNNRWGDCLKKKVLNVYSFGCLARKWGFLYPEFRLLLENTTMFASSWAQSCMKWDKTVLEGISTYWRVVGAQNVNRVVNTLD